LSLLRPVPCEGERSFWITLTRQAESSVGVVLRGTVEEARPVAGEDTRATGTIVAGADVILAVACTLPAPGFRIATSRLDTRPMSRTQTRRKYEARRSVTGRYAVLDRLDGSGPGLVRGHMTYHRRRGRGGSGADPFPLSGVRARGLLHLASFYPGMRVDGQTPPVIPAGIGKGALEVAPSRQAKELLLEARLTRETSGGMHWEAHALDSQDRVVLAVEDLQMLWFRP